MLLPFLFQRRNYRVFALGVNNVDVYDVLLLEAKNAVNRLIEVIAAVLFQNPEFATIVAELLSVETAEDEIKLLFNMALE